MLEARRLRVRAARGGRGPAEPRRAAARQRATARRCACSATSTPCSPTRRTGRVDPWSGELRDGCVWGRGALDMKGQVAAEVAAAARSPRRAGARPGELLVVITADEEAGAEHGAQWLCSEHADKVRCDFMVNEGAGEVVHFDGRRVYGVCVAEKGVFRFTLTTHGEAGHASIPRIGDNALTKLAPLLQAMRDRQPSLELSPEPEALLTRAGHRPVGPRGRDSPGGARPTRAWRSLVEPLLGVTFTPTMVQRLREDQRDPRAGVAEGGLPRAAGARARTTRSRIAEVLGEDGWSIEFDEQVVGNRSPIETPLMDAIRGWVEREDPGAVVAADGPARLHRLALVPRGVPRLRRLRLLPAARDGPVRGRAAGARRGRARRRSTTSASPPTPTSTSAGRCCRERGEAAARRHGAAQRPARARADALGRRGAHEATARSRSRPGASRPSARVRPRPGRARGRAAGRGVRGHPAGEARAARGEAADAGRADARRDGRRGRRRAGAPPAAGRARSRARPAWR